MGWRLGSQNLGIELKVRWAGHTEDWDTWEKIEHHLWSFKQVRQDIVAFLAKYKNAHTTLASMHSRLLSKLRSSKISKPTTYHRRGKDPENPHAVYQRRSGGWVVPSLGTLRVFSSRTRAYKALRKHNQESAKASSHRELGGSVALGSHRTPTIYNKSSHRLTQRRHQRRTRNKGPMGNNKSHRHKHRRKGKGS